jgi:hypothetical protein
MNTKQQTLVYVRELLFILSVFAWLFAFVAFVKRYNKGAELNFYYFCFCFVRRQKQECIFRLLLLYFIKL